MQNISAVAARILPILFLIALGNVLRIKDIVSETAIEDMKTIVVNAALPAVFFLSFLGLELARSHLTLVLLIFAVCMLQLFYGRLAAGIFGLKDTYFSFLNAGFELGMVGITLFGAAFGLEKVGYMGVYGIGHEFFVWFILVTLLISRRDGESRLGANLVRFVTSPVIIAIFSGILFNLLGLRAFLRDFIVTGALLSTFEYLSHLTIPLILLIVGYGMTFDLQDVGPSLLVVAARLGLAVPLALLLSRFVLGDLLHLDPLYAHALFTILILPPPFVIPIFIRRENTRGLRFVNNTLTIHTIFSIGLFILYLLVIPAG